LEAVCKAYKLGLAIPVLCGDRNKILDISAHHSIDIEKFEIINTADAKQSAKKAVSLVREGKAGVLMKGNLQTVELLREVLHKEEGLRLEGILSHVSIVHSPALERIVLITDAAIVTYPDIDTKIKIIENAVLAANGLGINNPKVALLAAVEVVNPKMQATTDAAVITMMNKRGQIKGCVIDGPLAMDLAISGEAAAEKNIVSEVAGKADILVFHDIEAANSSVKVFTHAGNSLFGGIVMGAAAPIVLTSRSDSIESKLYSMACAVNIANR
jgi:phosphate butyryltransferase